MKKFLKLGLMIFASLALVACGLGTDSSKNSLEAIQDKGELVVAMSPDSNPFEFQTLVDGKNTIVGADVLLAQDIADELGVELKLSPMSFNNVLSSLKTGKADLAISEISYTEERAKVYDFSDSYYDTTNILIVKKDNAANYTSLEDLAGQSVGVQIGTTQEGDAKKQLTDSTVISLTSTGELINQLKAGQLDAVLLGDAVATGYISQNSDLTNLEITVEPSEDEYIAVAMPKDSPELKAAVNKVIAKVKGEVYSSYIAEAASYTEIAE